jgi:hypothetical protein
MDKGGKAERRKVDIKGFSAFPPFLRGAEFFGTFLIP